jgi:hypothetical protein
MLQETIDSGLVLNQPSNLERKRQVTVTTAESRDADTAPAHCRFSASFLASPPTSFGRRAGKARALRMRGTGARACGASAVAIGGLRVEIVRLWGYGKHTW